MKVGILETGGNILSLKKILNYIGFDTNLINSKEYINNFDIYILPGIGSFDNPLKKLKNLSLLEFFANSSNLKNKKLIGICSGMQILFDYSEEDNTECLGLIKGTITKFNKKDVIAVPQMGWNKVECKLDNTLDGYYYFANSYFNKDSDYTVGYTSYGNQFSSIIKKDNLLGCQFHPEKSSTAGEMFLKNFINSI